MKANGAILRKFGVFLAVFSGYLAIATAGENTSMFYDGKTYQSMELKDVVLAVPPGSIVLLGEAHGASGQREAQIAFLNELKSQGHTVSVGMEFVQSRFQAELDAWLSGSLSESDFLNQIQWGATPFAHYRDQMRFPLSVQTGATIGINAPSFLTRKVGREGLSSLTSEERQLLPPNFQLGREFYRNRFLSLLPHQMEPEKMENYFAAQSIWDDHMAWISTKFIEENPTHTLVVIVGEFHIAYGGGLPDRIKQRSQVPVVKVSHLNPTGLSQAEIMEWLQPDENEGPRADFLWIGI